MSDVSLQFERLRRHYDLAVRSHDHVSFLDLSHALRIWVELKSHLDGNYPSFSSTKAFKTGCPSKRLLKAAKGCRYVFCYMPGDVITYASNGQIVSGPEDDFSVGPMKVSVGFMVDADGAFRLRSFCFVSRQLDDSYFLSTSSVSITRCNYQQWLGAEVVKLSYADESGVLNSVCMSREILIKRVANTLDASHPTDQNSVGVNKFDAPLRHLLKYAVGDLPLPYFILLKIAQDILDIAPGLIGLSLDYNSRRLRPWHASHRL